MRSSSHPHKEAAASNRAAAARNLIRLLTPLLTDDVMDEGPNSAILSRSQSRSQSPLISRPACLPEHVALQPTSSINSYREILSAIQALAITLIPKGPVFATFHDGQVHDPLGGGAYAFQDDVIEPVLLALKNDENHLLAKSNGNVQLLTRPIVIHAGAQPNNSPHVGTLAVLCFAFSLAREIRDRMQAQTANTDHKPPPVSVQVTFVDTAPVKDQGVEIEGIQYQRSYRDVLGALDSYMAEYEEALRLLSTWSDIPFTTAFQSDFFSHPIVPSLLRYIIAHHDLLGHQLSPKYGILALRAACPIPGCGLAEKHGRLNVYNDNSHHQNQNARATSRDATITFHCPHHGQHTICISEPADLARLEANAPARNLIRSMSHLLDTNTHHVRITGADYAGMYQEVFLYRPLAAWSAATGLAAGRTPHILYTPLIVDWSGAKLSKTLYVREGGYEAMKVFGTDGLCSFARLKSQFVVDGEDDTEGLRRVWQEVQGWVEDPRKLFRTFSVDYLQRIIINGEKWTS